MAMHVVDTYVSFLENHVVAIERDVVVAAVVGHQQTLRLVKHPTRSWFLLDHDCTRHVQDEMEAVTIHLRQAV